MKILCQEHYDKVVKYAKEIGDTSLDNCLKKLEQWENNPNCPCEIELYRDFALPTRSVSGNAIRTERQVLSGD